ncbi:MAG: hypothetical protein ACE5IZ_08305 [Dehalococcoidia bacterium]
MVNVRIDSQGVPKGPVYEEAAPVLHRSAVSFPDTADPTAASQGLACAGYRNLRLDIDTTASVGLTALKVQLLVWNTSAGKFFGGAEREFDAAELAANPKPALEAEVRGATIFLKVVSATATTLSVSIYATLS